MITVCNHKRTKASRVRSAFTLLELLIVIGLIALLVGLGIAGLGAALNSANENETKAFLKILQSFADDRARTVLAAESIGSSSVTSDAATFKSLYDRGSVNSPMAISQQAAEGLVRLNIYQGLLPQRVEDLFGFDGVPGSPGDDDSDGDADFSGTANEIVGDLDEYGFPGSDDSPLAAAVAREILSLADRTQFETGININEELLYLMFTVNTPGLDLGDKPSIDNIPASRIGDSDGDGVPEFIDSFGTPIRFYAATDAALRPTVSSAAPTLAPQPVLAVQYTWFSDLVGGAGESFSDLDAKDGSTDGEIALALATASVNKSPYDRFNAVGNGGYAAAAGGYRLGGASGSLCPSIDRIQGTLSKPLVVSAGPDETWGVLDPTDGDNDPSSKPTGAPYAGRRYFGPWRFYQITDSAGTAIDFSAGSAANDISSSPAIDNITGGQALNGAN